MPPIVRWFRDIRERIFGKFYDGPEPPDRLAQMVIAFALTTPQATRFDWTRFAIDHARECYRAGYTRGVEYVERDPDERALLSQLDPDAIADALSPDWRWSPELDLNGIPKEPVQEFVFGEPEEMERLMKQVRET